MRAFSQIVTVVLCTTLMAGAAWGATKLKTDREKDSYAVGANVARKLKQQGVELDPDMVAKGVTDGLGGKSLLTDEEIDASLQKLQKLAKEKAEAERQKTAAKNKERGEAFLAEYDKKEGVQTLPVGVRYRVLQAGSGETPNNDSYVNCHYRGTLVDGTVFDASQEGKPSTFKVLKVIPGWREALKQMPVGSKWEVVIPAGMAYGERGAAPAIGPNETLIFEIELVGLED